MGGGQDTGDAGSFVQQQTHRLAVLNCHHEGFKDPFTGPQVCCILSPCHILLDTQLMPSASLCTDALAVPRHPNGMLNNPVAPGTGCALLHHWHPWLCCHQTNPCPPAPGCASVTSSLNSAVVVPPAQTQDSRGPRPPLQKVHSKQQLMNLFPKTR